MRELKLSRNGLRGIRVCDPTKMSAGSFIDMHQVARAYSGLSWAR